MARAPPGRLTVPARTGHGLPFGPAMVLAPLGGVLADRLDKRRTLIVVNVVAMLQASILFALTLTG